MLCRWCIHRQHCHIVIYHPQWFTSSHRPTPTPLDLSSVLRQGNARNSALSRMLNPPHVQLSSPLSLHVRLPRSRPSIAIFNLINSLCLVQKEGCNFNTTHSHHLSLFFVTKYTANTPIQPFGLGPTTAARQVRLNCRLNCGRATQRLHGLQAASTE